MSEQDVVADIFEKAIQKHLRGKDANNEKNKSYGEEYISRLKAACSSLLKKELFEVGQIVKWKENLNNRTLPYKNQPAIVVSILDEPVISNEDNSGSPYFLESLDIILGIIDDGTFVTFYYDSRRFEAY